MGGANTLLFLSTALMLSGTAQFFGQSLPSRFFPVLLVVAALSWWWLNGHERGYEDRVAFIVTLLGVLHAWHAHIIYRQPNKTFAARFTFAVLVTLIAVSLVRAVSARLVPTANSLFEPSLPQMVYILSNAFGLLLLSIGAVLMASEDLRHRLQTLATEDTLTKALTRRALFELGELELARSRRSSAPLSVLMLDLDHFKEINDTHGHKVGDAVLCDFVERTHTLLRRPSILARYGGEEFVAVLPETDAAQALAVAERIRDSKSTRSDLPEHHVSIGIATTLHNDQRPLMDLIDQADRGLYLAKERGRNRVETATA